MPPTAPTDSARRAGRLVSALVFGLLALALAACGAIERLVPPSDEREPEAPPSLTLSEEEFKNLPGWQADILADGLQAFLQSCPVIAKRPAGESLGYRPEHGTMGDLQAICRDAAKINTDSNVEIRFFFESRFRPFLVRGNSRETGIFTGYYEPLLRGSWQRDNRYVYPVYTRPLDIIVVELDKFDPDRRGEQLAGRLVDNKLVPYYDRREIEAGALTGQRLELLFAENPVDLYFLHVQGSGRVLLPDGSFVRLAFSGRNGHRYTSIGRKLVAQGIMPLKDVTLFSLRNWMRENPLAAQNLMQANRSYIFFRVEKDDAVKGAMGAPLTPGRSLAVDPNFVPLGVPIWLITTDPLDPKNKTPLRRLVVAQDTGSAIKGPVRGDLFWGFGEQAESRAGLMNEAGAYYVLLPKKPL